MKAKIDISKGTLANNHLLDFDTENSIRITRDQHPDIELKNVIAFPGLVNAHDHLEFNLFPFLANKYYDNYEEWGKDIHETHGETIQSILKIPLDIRIKWGLLKNLLNGSIFVVHHGLHHDKIKRESFLSVHLDYQYFHALATERFWKLKLNLPIGKQVMIHVGEGVDSKSQIEIDRLIQNNLFNRDLIGIHAISMSAEQSKKFKAIIWCPESNLKLYRQTADINGIKTNTRILFGMDSNLSASSDLWQHIRKARDLHLLSDNELLDALISNPFKVFKWKRDSSIVIARKKFSSASESFFSLHPEDLLFITFKDEILLADSLFFEDMPADQYAKISVGQSQKWIPLRLASMVSELEEMEVKLPLDVHSSKV